MKGMRFFHTIQSKIIIIYVLLILMAMQLIGVYFVRTMERSFIDNFTDSLHTQANVLARFAERDLNLAPESSTSNDEGKRSYSELNEIVNNLFNISDAEVQIIDANGIVVTSSSRNQMSRVGQKTTQAEIVSALQGVRDNESEMTDSSGHRYKIVAQPIGEGTKVLGAVYIIASMESLYGTMNRINQIFLSGTGIALVLTVLLGVILSHTITNPIKEITKQATAMAEGNFNQKVLVKGPDEIGQLGNAFNYMTNRSKEALYLNEEEKEKLSSVLSNMNDGVIATDERGIAIVVNPRAQQMLQLEEWQLTNRTLTNLLGISEEVIDQQVRGERASAMITVGKEEEDQEMYRVVFTRIQRRDSGLTGMIAMLQDVTEQEKLENARREFVANVSHELRTPLTTMKSYLEALDDGAIEEPALAHRFVGVMRNETERMIRLVNDLLHLSRLDSRKSMMAKELTHIGEMLEEVADRFSFQLDQKLIHISIDADASLGEMMLDRDQIDQVLDNLISNAIKYSHEEGSIQLTAHKNAKGWLEIRIQDNGIGIPKKDLAHIFDRFYRVDKARSRNMGGTGLGLSIAREIVKAHGGTIALESELNQGTRVTFSIPVLQIEGEHA